MSNIAVIPQINLPPALLQQFQALNGADDLDSGVSAGFPVISIKGAKWRIVEGGEEHPIFMPGTKDLAPFVKVVILRANAAISKTYYEGQYVEGSDAKPTCYSNDGIRPAADVEHPQAETCAACPHNVWGSKISPSGAKIKACADVRRIAILPAEDLDYSPILLRIPGASLGDLAGYGKALKQRGIPYAAVVTKLAFDPDAAFPKITFTFERVLTSEEMNLVAGRMSEPVVEDILGLTQRSGAPVAHVEPATDGFGIPADITPPAQPAAQPAAEPAAEPAQAAAPAKPARASRAKKGGFNTGDAAPAAETQAAPEPAAEPVASAPSGDIGADIDAALASINL